MDRDYGYLDTRINSLVSRRLDSIEDQRGKGRHFLLLIKIISILIFGYLSLFYKSNEYRWLWCIWWFSKGS